MPRKYVRKNPPPSRRQRALTYIAQHGPQRVTQMANLLVPEENDVAVRRLRLSQTLTNAWQDGLVERIGEKRDPKLTWALTPKGLEYLELCEKREP